MRNYWPGSDVMTGSEGSDSLKTTMAAPQKVTAKLESVFHGENSK